MTQKIETLDQSTLTPEAKDAIARLFDYLVSTGRPSLSIEFADASASNGHEMGRCTISVTREK